MAKDYKEQAKKYKESDRSTPEKRGYAVEKSFFEDDSTGPEQNIGPEFRAENVKKLLPGETATSTKKRSGEWEKGFNKAKAEAQEPTGPKFKKGGSVSSASKRADGCAVRGRTKA
jgi:hypothetical protein